MADTKPAPATQVNVFTSDDAQSSGIIAKTKDGVVGFAVQNRELSKLAALLIEQSQKVAVAKIAEAPTGQPAQRSALTVHPIQASGAGIGKGRSDGEVTLMVEVGNMTLAFFVQATTLQRLCDDLHSSIQALSEPQRPN